MSKKSRTGEISRKLSISKRNVTKVVEFQWSIHSGQFDLGGRHQEQVKIIDFVDFS